MTDWPGTDSFKGTRIESSVGWTGTEMPTVWTPYSR